MKRIFKMMFPVLAVTMLISCGPSTEDAVTYNNYIVEQMDKVQKADSVIASMEKDKTVMEATEKNLETQLSGSIDNIKKNGGFDKTTELMDAAVHYLNSYKAVADSVYREMIDINSKPLEKLTEADDTRYKELQEMCNTKMEGVSHKFDSIQNAFASKYKFEIEGKSASKK